MWWRDDATKSTSSARERAKELVEGSKRPPGLIAYRDGEPVGWAALGPREDYPRLQRGRDTGPIDERAGVWAVPCFFVCENQRGQGIAKGLLRAAVELAATHGASAIEGVPRDPAVRRRSASSSYTGTTGMFAELQFVEIRRRKPEARVLMRRELQAVGSQEGDGE